LIILKYLISPCISCPGSYYSMVYTAYKQRFLHTMRAVQGAIITSSTIHIVLGFSGLWGILARY
jgi:hypothetical protein